jgi:hypothetical protein
MFRQDDWPELPDHTRDWLKLQREVSRLPERDRLLVESFPHDGREHLVAYGFAGQERAADARPSADAADGGAGPEPMGFVATDYATLIWGLEPVGDAVPLFSRENLIETMETWLADNAVMKRTFKGSAIIAGLIDRAMPGGKRKTGRQTAFSTDILYDTLRKYDPDHVMLEITRNEAMRGLVDFGRIEAMLERIGDRIDHVRLTRVTPLAAPLFLEPGRVPVDGLANQRLMEEEADRLMRTQGWQGLIRRQRAGLADAPSGPWHGTFHERPCLPIPRRNLPRPALRRALLAVRAASCRVRPAHGQIRARGAARRPDAAALRGHRHAPAPVRRHRATAPKPWSASATASTTPTAADALDEVTAGASRAADGGPRPGSGSRATMTPARSGLAARIRAR